MTQGRFLNGFDKVLFKKKKAKRDAAILMLSGFALEKCPRAMSSEVSY